MFIVMTEEQADAVSVVYGVEECIKPVALDDGRYILSTSLLNNAEIPQAVRDVLATYPQEDVELPQGDV